MMNGRRNSDKPVVVTKPANTANNVVQRARKASAHSIQRFPGVLDYQPMRSIAFVIETKYVSAWQSRVSKPPTLTRSSRFPISSEIF